MTLFRLFARAIILLSLLSIGLLGSILFVVGAFHPVKFFVAAGEIQRDQPVLLVSEAGETLKVASRADTTTLFQNRLVWLDDEFDLTHWENGRTQQVGQLWEGSMQEAEWSSGGLLAWEASVEGRSHLKLWDGETSRDIDPESEQVSDFFWTPEDALLWVETDANGRWWLRRWADDIVTDLTSPSDQNLISTQFFDCEGAALHVGDGVLLYYDGQLNPLPDSLTEFETIQTDDCQTFLLDGVGSVTNRYDALWNGSEETPLTFQGFGIRGADEVIGLQTHSRPTPATHLTLVHQQNGVIETEELDLPRPVNYPSLMFWDGPFSLWRVSQVDSIVLLLWNYETGEVSQVMHHLDAGSRYIYGANQHRAAWFYSTQPSTIHLTIWEDQQFSQHSLKISDGPVAIHDVKLQWMGDGTLMVGMVEDDLSITGERLYTHVYRWDGQALHPLTILPSYAGPISDWMTWE